MKSLRVVSVSLFEGYPNAVLKPMACGCPLVVSDVPAHGEFLGKHSDLPVNPHAPAAIADAIASVLSAPEAATRRVQTAGAKVGQSSIPAIASQYDEVYRKVLARRARLDPNSG